MEVAISEFKAKCIHLLKATAESGDELVVTLRGKPLARVIGVPQERQRVLGGQREPLDADAADRMLVATARELGCVLVTADDLLLAYRHVMRVDARC